MTENAQPYDALLLCSFGGPNGPDDVIPFLKNVTRGKGIPEDRLAEVGEHYAHFGGKSPINEQNQLLTSALQAELRRRSVNLPVIWGNRNWHPYTVDSLRDAAAFGAKRVLAVVTSAYASYSGSRQYREHLAAAVAELGDVAPDIDIVRPFFNDPGFIRANLEAIEEAATGLPGGFQAHTSSTSPTPFRTQCRKRQRSPAPDIVSSTRMFGPRSMPRWPNVTLAPLNSSLSYCSRSGSPQVPWLEPDVSDHLTELAKAGVTKVVIAPIGFISDHMEVAFDLDVEALETAEAQGISAVRAGTAGIRSAFVSGLVDMVFERAARERGEPVEPVVTGFLAALPDVAPPGSCRMRHGEVTGIPVIAGTED